MKHSKVLLRTWTNGRLWISSSSAKVCLCFFNSLSSLSVGVDNVARLEIQKDFKDMHENGRSARP